MVATRASDFLTLLGEYHLLDSRQMEQVRRLPEVESDDALALVRWLRRKEWLTRYQLRQIYRGQGRELALGPYRLLEPLAEGGMGRVFRARHEKMGREVALKIIRHDRLAQADAVQRFEREVQAAAQVHHPNIVLAFDAGQAGSTLYLAMEYLRGSDLFRLVEQQGPLPVAVACDYVRQAAEGLEYVHRRGLVHRDIKPSNLFVTDPDPATGTDGGVVKILDLGLCRVTDRDEEGPALTRQGRVLGTVAFLAPEQARDSHRVDIRADIYGLGCTLFYLLAGREPYGGETAVDVALKHIKEPVPSVRAYRPDLPVALDEVVRRMMAKKPDDRYQLPADVAAALRPFLQGGSQPPVPVALPVTPPVTRPVPQDAMATALDVTGGPPAPVPPPSRPVDPTAMLDSRPIQKQLRTAPRWTWPAVAGVVLVVALLVAILWPRSKPSPQKDGRAEIPRERAPRDGGAVLLPPEPTPEEPPPPLPDRDGIGQLVRWERHGRLVVVLPDGRRAVSDREDGMLVEWELATGKVRRSFGRLPTAATSLALSPDGKQLLAGGLDATLPLWHVESGKAGPPLTTAVPAVQAVGFSPGGELAFAAVGRRVEQGGKVQRVEVELPVWDTRTGQQVGKLTPGSSEEVPAALSVSPDGKQVLVGGWDRQVWLWTAPLDSPPRRLGEHRQAVTAVAFSPDGRWAYSAGRDGKIYSWDVVTGRLRFQVSGHASVVNALAVSSDGRRLLTGSVDQTVRLWDADTGASLHTFTGHRNWVTAVAFTPDGLHGVSADRGHDVFVWRLR